MTVNVDTKLISYLAKKWEDKKEYKEVADIIEAIVAELKRDYRDAERKYRMSEEDVEYWESLIADVQSPIFWEKLDHLLNFRFDY